MSNSPPRSNAERAVAALVVALAACVHPPPPAPSLAERLDSLAIQHEAEGAAVGIAVFDAATGAPLYLHREHARQTPASTMKLATTTAALASLGAEWRFRTSLWLEGTQNGPEFGGSVRVDASGDPSFGSWRWPETDPVATCDRVAQALAARGVRSWTGALRLSNANDDVAPLGPGWAWDDAGYDYSAPPTRFVFRENVVNLRVTRGSPEPCEQRPEVVLDPPLAMLTTDIQLDAMAPGAALICHRDHGSNAVRCTWKHQPPNCPREANVEVAIDDPLASFSACVDAALARAGIAHHPPPPTIAPTPEDAPTPEKLLDFDSPTLSQLVKATNKESLNLYAERLALELTRLKAGQETYADLRTTMQERATLLGLAAREHVQVDGSGLSRYNLTTAFSLANIVRAALTANSADAFVDSLPVAGVDGTLAKRTQSSEAKGRVRAKSGSMSGQRSWAGIADRPKDPAHPRVVFAVMLGNIEQPTVGPGETFDRVADALVTAPIR